MSETDRVLLPDRRSKTDIKETINGDSESLPEKDEVQSDSADDKNNYCKIETDLLIYKSFYFAFSGAIGAIAPLIVLYYKQLGFGPDQIGIISGLRPLVGFISAPVVGSIASKFKISKLLLIVSLIGWLGFFMAIGLIPPPKLTTKHCPAVKYYNGPNSTHYNAEMAKMVTVYPKPGVSYNESLLEDREWMFEDDDLYRVFVIIICLIVVGEIVQCPVSALSDAACLEHLGRKNIWKYGIQRCWGGFGFGLLALISGSVVSTTRTPIHLCGMTVTFSDYRLAFYIYAGLVVITFISACFFKFPSQNSPEAEGKNYSSVKAAFRIFKSVHYGAWLFCMIFMGICNGIIWGFLNWHLENIGATQFLIGVATVVSSCSEIVTFAVIFPILDRLGYPLFMGIGLFSYIVRFGAYSLIENPWLVMPFEVLQGFTYAGVWSAIMGYLCTAIPVECLSTMQGILHGVYWGLGSGTGHVIGGLLVEHFGARITFGAFAVAAFVICIIFGVTQKFSTKPPEPDAEEYHELSER